MSNFKIGDYLKIHCYKHDKNIYRSSDKALILDINDEGIVVGNNHATVTKANGRTWQTKEPAIIFFYKNKWYNVISQLKDNGIYFYCNIATPYIIEDGAIKYIDYDLDLRIFPDGKYKILDTDEYELHQKEMNYSDEINLIIKNELDDLINTYKMKKGPFNFALIQKYYEKYLETVSSNE